MVFFREYSGCFEKRRLQCVCFECVSELVEELLSEEASIILKEGK